MVAMPMIDAHACIRPEGGRQLAVAFIFDMGPKRHDRGGGCQALRRIIRRFFTLRKKQLATGIGESVRAVAHSGLEYRHGPRGANV